ncbi:putative leader peptide [Actinacidiphila oryziradicis]
MQARRSGGRDGRMPHHGGSFELRVARRHVDLLRVSSALCPSTSPGC